MRGWATVLLAVATLMVGACSGDKTSGPQPETSGPTRTAAKSSDAASSVPRVANPVDTSRLEREPCSVLTEEQLHELSIANQPKPDLEAPAGPTCRWDGYDEVGLAFSGGFITAGSSLAGSYKKNRRGGFDNFKPTTIAGYPGYFHKGDGEKDQCTAVVAVRNDLLYSMVATVDEESPYYGKPCVIAKKAATMATTTMSGGA